MWLTTDWYFNLKCDWLQIDISNTDNAQNGVGKSGLNIQNIRSHQGELAKFKLKVIYILKLPMGKI